MKTLSNTAPFAAAAANLFALQDAWHYLALLTGEGESTFADRRSDLTAKTAAGRTQLVRLARQNMRLCGLDVTVAEVAMGDDVGKGRVLFARVNAAASALGVDGATGRTAVTLAAVMATADAQGFKAACEAQVASFTVVYQGRKGDIELHACGCSDLKKHSGGKMDFQAASLDEAVQYVVDDLNASGDYDSAWTASSVEVLPCARKAAPVAPKAVAPKTSAKRARKSKKASTPAPYAVTRPRHVGAYRNAYRKALRAEEQAIESGASDEVCWKLAAKADKALRAAQLAERVLSSR